MKRKAVIFTSILALAVLTGYRIQRIRAEEELRVNNIVRIQAERGAPHDYVVAKKSSGVLLEPLFVQNGRALVTPSRIGRFSVGDKIYGKNAVIAKVSKSIDLDTGMFVIIVSGAITGDVFVEKRYTGFFLPIDAVLPTGARVIAKDAERMVVVGLRDGDRIIVR